MDSNVISFLQTASAAVNQTEANAINKLVTKLKAYGQYAFIDGLFLECLSDTNLRKTNIITATSATVNGTVNHVPKRGNAGDGTTGYINTGLNASTLTNFNQNSGLILTHIRDNISEASIDCGVFDGSASGAWVSAKWNTDSKFYGRCNSNNSICTTSSITDCRGFQTVRRNGSIEDLLSGKSVVKTATTTSSSRVNANFMLGSATATNYLGTRRRSITLIGSASVNIEVVIDLLQDFLKDSGSSIKVIHGMGDSIMAGYNASPIPSNSYAAICAQAGYDFINYGSSGQTVSQGTSNPVNFSNIPVYNALYDSMLIFSWGVNDCWQNTNINSFLNYYMQAIYKAINNGWPKEKIIIFDGYYVENNANFSQSTYYATVQAIQTMADSFGIVCPRIKDYMTANGAGTLIDGTDKVHPVNIGHAVIFNVLKEYLG